MAENDRLEIKDECTCNSSRTNKVNLKSQSIIFACLVALNDITAPSPCDLFQVGNFILVLYT